ncbi:MAG: MATE family efflux transporter [Oscillibacter sp.]|nr:MATE family efflux transporter [Oscillibacter sp.]
MEEKGNTYLATEPIGKLLVRLAVPTVAAQLINMLYNLVDRIYIGHIPGTGALALTGLGVCMPVILIVTAFAALTASGGAPRASIEMGRGDNGEAQRILANCFSFQILIGAVLTVLLLIFSRPMLLAFGASANTIGYADAYLKIYALGTVSVQLTLGMNAFITAQGFAKSGMLTVMLGAVCNIILDPVLIFGFHMGVRGAALATIISQTFSCVWVLIFLRGKKTILRLRPRGLRLEPEVILPCLALGLATFIMQASESVIAVCFNSSLLRYGGDMAVGAMTILTSVMQLGMLPMQGLGQGSMPITSYNYGAGNADRVRRSFFLLLRASLCYSITVWVLLMLFPGGFARIFSDNAALIRYTENALRIYAAGMGIFGAQTACQMTFVSIGNARASIVVAVMRKFVLLIPLIYLLPHLLADPVAAVYTAEPVADVCAVLFTVTLFRFQFRKALRKLEA